MADVEKKKTQGNGSVKGVSRRQFLKGTGAVVAGSAAIGAVALACEKAAETPTPAPTAIPTATATAAPTATPPPAPPKRFTDPDGQQAFRTLALSIPASTGYLMVDSKKCAGCLTCMLACSLVHEGEENLSLSRIQIAQDKFGRFPEDLQQYQCRQCVTPACVELCPTGACHIDTAHGNVRVIDETKCIGCQTCLSACPQQPHRTIWNPTKKKATKCDLCINTPFWDNTGGPDGKQACVEVCPLQAVKLVKSVPSQIGDTGYDVNLRNANYKALGLNSDTY